MSLLIDGKFEHWKGEDRRLRTFKTEVHSDLDIPQTIKLNGPDGNLYLSFTINETEGELLIKMQIEERLDETPARILAKPVLRVHYGATAQIQLGVEKFETFEMTIIPEKL